MSKELRFDGRVALVTGAGGGLGREHALLLASRGARVAVNELPRNVHEAEKVVAEIEAAGGQAIAVPGRIGADEDARAMVAAVVDAFGRIDIVVNNAGTVGDKVLVQNDPGEGFQSELDVNIIGPLQLNRAAWPHMEKQGYGRILFTSSAVAIGWYREPHGYEGSYAAGKAGIFGIARQTAAAGEELGNIKANILMPWAYTPMVDGNLGGSEFGDWMKANMRPGQVAASVLLLLHEDCPVNGQAISAAGGRVTRILFASPKGYFNPDLTPEDVRDNWTLIEGEKGSDGQVSAIAEVRSQAHEYELILKTLERQ